MPFKNKSQLKKFILLVKQGKISKRKFNQWIKETPNIKALPNKARKRKKKGRK